MASNQRLLEPSRILAAYVRGLRRLAGAGCGTSIRVRVVLGIAFLPLGAPSASAQFVDDGSDAAIGKDAAQTILDLVKRNIKNSSDAKVTSLRKSRGSFICGSVNVKNRDGLYLGERGFVVDLARRSFGRVPEGPELLSPRFAGFEEKERIRQLYFEMCLD